MRNFLIALSLFLLTSCIGTHDPLYGISGHVRTDQSCSVQIKLSKSGEIISDGPVKGDFQEHYETDDGDETFVDIFAYCNGKEVKAMKGILPQDERNIDLG